MEEGNKKRKTDEGASQATNAVEDESPVTMKELRKWMLEMRASQDAQGKRLDALLASSPLALLKLLNSSVVGGKKAELVGIRHGASATWTYLRNGDQCLAIGSAHCAFYYRTRGGKCFCSLPREEKK